MTAFQEFLTLNVPMISRADILDVGHSMSWSMRTYRNHRRDSKRFTALKKITDAAMAIGVQVEENQNSGLTIIAPNGRTFNV